MDKQELLVVVVTERRVKFGSRVADILCSFLLLSMGYLCAVKGCGHNTLRDKGLYSFFRFPGIRTDRGKAYQEMCEARRRLWLAQVFRGDLMGKSIENTCVCSIHFVKG